MSTSYIAKDLVLKELEDYRLDSSPLADDINAIPEVTIESLQSEIMNNIVSTVLEKLSGKDGISYHDD